MAPLTSIDGALAVTSLVLGFFLAPAFTRVADSVRNGYLPLSEIRTIALSAAPPGPSRRRASTTSSTSDSNQFWLFVGAMIIAVGLYLKFRIPILIGISLLALCITVATITSLLRMSRAAVVADDRSFKYVVTCLIAATFGGLVNVSWLLNPPSGGATFRELLGHYTASHDVGSLSGFTYVVYQLAGAVAYVAVALMSIGFCVGIFTSINIYARSFGRPLWCFAFRRTSGIWGSRVFIAGVIVTTLSLVLCGGWAFGWTQHLDSSPPLPLPSAAH